MLFEAVWGYHFDPGTNLIDVHMGRLRKKIDPTRRKGDDSGPCVVRLHPDVIHLILRTPWLNSSNRTHSMEWTPLA